MAGLYTLFWHTPGGCGRLFLQPRGGEEGVECLFEWLRRQPDAAGAGGRFVLFDGRQGEGWRQPPDIPPHATVRPLPPEEDPACPPAPSPSCFCSTSAAP